MVKDYITPAERLENSAIEARRKAAAESIGRKHANLRLRSGAPIVGMHIADATRDSRRHTFADVLGNVLGGALALVLIYLFLVFGLAL